MTDSSTTPPTTAHRAEFRRFAEDLARRAGALALEGRRGFTTGKHVTHDTKSTATDPVTEFDRAAEALIVDAIRRTYPNDSIVGEEGTDHVGTSGMAWHIDPIDGTVNFIYDLPGWCTSIAVVDQRGSVAGAVYAPATDELYSAARGDGATLNGTALSCSTATELSLALVATGFTYAPTTRAAQGARLASLLPVVRDIRRNGSAALDLCMVAGGRVDAYFEEHLHSWDLAAGTLIAEEAGAITSNFGDGPASPTAAVAAAPGVHTALLDAIARIDTANLSRSSE